MRIVVATDLDGTIAFDGAPPARPLRTMLAAVAALPELRLVVATARSPRVVGEWLAPFADRLDRVCCNGAIVATPERQLHRRELPPALVARISGELARAGAEFCLEYGDRFAASCERALPWMGDRARGVLPADGAVAEGVVKLCVADGARWRPRLAELAGGAAVLVPHASGDLDLAPAGVHKAAGLARLERPGDLVLALGNDRNDFELLQRADRAIVVGDGLAGLERAAHVRRVAASPAVVAAAMRDGVRELLGRRRRALRLRPSAPAPGSAPVPATARAANPRAANPRAANPRPAEPAFAG